MAKSPLTIDELSDSDDPDLEMGFVSASQYDPEPTPKQLRQVERAQQAKLAALKEWTHIDSCKPATFKDMRDNLLHNLVCDDYEALKKAKARSTKKRKSSGLSDSDDDDEVDVVPDSAEESGYDTDTHNGTRKRGGRSSARSSRKLSNKKHDLQALAPDHAGRVLFVFEKLSESRL